MATTATQLQAEREEVEVVLKSRIFNRAPSLASFLRYICDQHFDRNAENLKEYSIAVEALGRPSDFDQKKDSIVRVEAHRLRKRLADYYSTIGADHAVHIVIPNGQYAPQFVCKGRNESQNQEDLTPPVAVDLNQPVEPLPEAVPTLPVENSLTGRPKSSGFGFLMIAAGALAVVIALSLYFAFRAGGRSAVREVWHGATWEPVASEFRMLAGYHGKPFVDRQGRIWQPDKYYDGGDSMALPRDVLLEGLPDPGFAKTEREGDFQYSIPERPGTYEIHLYFADVESQASDSASVKLFRVSLNRKVVLEYFDPLSDAGAPNRLTSRVFKDIRPGSDGRIHLKFEQQGRKPMLLAIEILWSKPGTIRPIRIVTGNQSVTDPDGSVWMADQYAVGGMTVQRQSSIQDSELKPLFAGERFGNFSYRIPVPPGKYRVRLFFAETFFGSKLPFSGPAQGPGARVFNVFSGGVTLLRNFDIIKEAGGPNRAAVKTFDDLEPNAQGKIVLEFEPVRNYAEVNALEVTQMEPDRAPTRQMGL